MGNWNEVEGKDKNDWHGTEMYRDQAGNEIRMGMTPNGREIFIKHAHGTHFHINDKGEVAIKATGQQSEIYLKGRNIEIAGAMNLICKGDITFTAEKMLNFEGKSISMKATGGNIDMKADGGGNITMESENFSKSTTGNTDDKTGGSYGRTVGGDSNETVNGDRQVTAKNNTQIVSGDNTTMTGGEHSISAAGTMGLGAAEMGIASTGIIKLQSQTQIQTRAETGTFIKDGHGIQIESFGGGGTVVAAAGYKAGIFSKDHDVRIGSGGKLLVETDDGSKIDTAAIIPGIGGFYPT